MVRPVNHSGTRQHILRAALKRFANNGYAAASVQQIVGDAKVSKPALYYHFRDKAGLFQALVDEAHDQRLRLMREAAHQAPDFEGQLVGILTSLFEFMGRNRELMRIAFATAFAAPGEVPASLHCSEKCERNFDFLRDLMERALRAGVLDRQFDSEELAHGFYGLLNSYLATNLLMPDCGLNREKAVRIVRLFLAGAAAKRHKASFQSRHRKAE